ncbi:MAG: hypothetical protein AAFX80_03525 [Cyanobacteria bacterium J06639_18]
MVLPFIAGFVAGLLIGSIVVGFLSYEEIIDWFNEHIDTIHNNEDNLAFTIKDILENGNYKIVQGVFNSQTGDVIEDRVIEAEEIDEELLEIHEEYENEENLVIYEF